MQIVTPHKFSDWRSLKLIGLIAIVFSLQSCEAQHKRGAATPERIVEQYLLALEERNEILILQLMPEESLADKEIKAKIDKLGGHKIQDRQINYTKPTPTLWNAKMGGFYIDPTGVRKKFDDSIAVEYQNKGQVKLYRGRWYLLLGSR
ncbi:hypothetical protein [Chamaesiphon sp.]|uniref:hypothetical protein n=1 Tax=Chamaesiphon sp. TaxID=2814140 RepID=UPI003593F9F9